MAISNRTTTTLEIQLTRGLVAIVDAEDADLSALKWHAQSCQKQGMFYAAHKPFVDGRYITEFMHRIILSRMLERPLLRSEHVDHIHHNTLDNRRLEIRLASPSQNQHNRGMQVRNTSGFKGVSYEKARGCWLALIGFQNKRYNLGRFPTAIEAAIAYDKAARELHGAFAYQNFPISNDGAGPQ